MKMTRQVVALGLAAALSAAVATTTPQQTAASPAADALQALDALHSALSVRVNYAEYRARFIDVKIVTDRYLQTCPSENVGCTLVRSIVQDHTNALWACGVSHFPALLLRSRTGFRGRLPGRFGRKAGPGSFDGRSSGPKTEISNERLMIGGRENRCT